MALTFIYAEDIVRTLDKKDYAFVETVDGKYHILVNDDGPDRLSMLAFDFLNGTEGVGGGGGIIVIGRTALTTDTTIYFRADGDGTGDGTIDDTTAFPTVQAAYDHVCDSLDLAGYTVTIQAGGTGVRTFASTTLQASFTKTWFGAGKIHILGDDTTPANVIVQQTGSAGIWKFAGYRPSDLYVSGFKVIGGDFSTDLLAVSGGGGRVVFDNPAGSGKITWGLNVSCAHVVAKDGGRVLVTADETVNANYATHILAIGTGEIVYQPRTLTHASAPTIQGSFASALRGGKIDATIVSKSGGVTGKRYIADDFGIINTNGGGASYFPGATAGTSNTSTYF